MKENLTSLLLPAETVQQIIQKIGIDEVMDQLIELTYNTFVNYDRSNSIMPIRSGFNYTEPIEGLIEWMPIRDIQDEEIIMKTVAYHPQNPTDYRLPTILSTISKYDTKTGHLIAIIDGVLPTALRTGAATAVASKLFGYPQSKVLGLIGCGAQSITQLHALSRIFSLEKVIYYDIDPITQASFEDRSSMFDLNVTFETGTIEEIAAASDILCTATSIGVGEGPLFKYEKTQPWLHVNAVGSDFAGKIELPKELLVKSYVCPDFPEQAKIEGECQQLSSEQIGKDIITCLKTANELSEHKQGLTVFDSTGMAIEDRLITDYFLSHADEMGLGTKVRLENASQEEKNPYAFLMNLKHK